MDNTEPAIVPDTLRAHAAALVLTLLERPHTVEESVETAGPDGVLVAILENLLVDLFSARDRGDDGEKGMIARHIVENYPAPFQMELDASMSAAAIH
ncbi:hypothetical protein [Kocuria arenosa]|uniref:hypothetical protein n=1 Tax=Kocuria arenosa TaxID=3071446 RepID=UPI0034D65D37